MDTKERVRDLLGRAIDRANEVRPPESRIPQDASTPLTGPEAALDSLGLVNLVVAVETLAEEEFGAPLSLFEEMGNERAATSFRTVGALAAFLEQALASRASR